jgi:hypothetical protein
MKTRFVNIACLVGAALAVFAQTAPAQGLTRVSVPFEFAAGASMMPAGDYIIDMPNSGVLILHGPAGASATLLTIASNTTTGSASAKLHFERKDGVTYLSGVDSLDESVRLASPFMRLGKVAASASLR